MWQCTRTTFVHHVLPPPCLVPRNTKPVEQDGSMRRAHPCARDGVGHPKRATTHEGHSAGSRATCAPSGHGKSQALQSSTKLFPHCGVFAQESCPRRCLSSLSTPPPPCYNSPYCQVKHQTGSAQTQVPRAWDAGLCHPMLLSFPQLGELQVLSCLARETPQLNSSPLPCCVPQHTPLDSNAEFYVSVSGPAQRSDTIF